MQSKHRNQNAVPTLEEYIDIRRDSSGLKPLIDFLEYTLEVNIPDEVMEHPVMEALKQNVNDFCTWTNVCKFPPPFLALSNKEIIFLIPGYFFFQQGASLRGHIQHGHHIHETGRYGASTGHRHSRRDVF